MMSHLEEKKDLKDNIPKAQNLKTMIKETGNRLKEAGPKIRIRILDMTKGKYTQTI